MTARLCLALFLSGVAALLFETVWFYQTGLAVGHSVWASSLVLAAFMGGLAVGSGLMGRFGHRLTRPLRWYALLECAIGVSGIAIAWILPHLTPVLAPLFRSVHDQPLALNTLRFLTAFALLVLPSTAMGATLPIVVDALRRREPGFGRLLGRLYGWNTLGAVAGTVAAEAVLIGWLGIRGTALAAGLMNGLAAAIAIRLARSLEREGQPAYIPSTPFRLSSTSVGVLAAAALSGGILLALEVVWFRLLGLFLRGDSLVFSMMLGIVLAGIGLGGLAGSWVLARRPVTIRDLPAIACCSGLIGLLAYAGFELILRGCEGPTVWRWDQAVALSSALMAPGALLSGALFTLLGEALDREQPQAARSAGLLTLANTTGAMLGSLGAAFLLLPRLGVEGSIRLLASGYGVVAVGLLLAGLRPSTWQGRAGLLLTAVALAGSLVVVPDGFVEQGIWRHRLQPMAAAEPLLPVAIREGLTETAMLLRRDWFGEPGYFRLMTDSNTMSSTGSGARRYMELFVYLPVAIHPAPRRALLISYGVGNTARALVQTRSLERIDVVDISRDLLELSRLVHPHPEDDPLNDPRVRVHVEDGRHFLQTTGERFDLITGEPPPPKNAGVVSLYTREHFALIRDRLADGGIATYWLPAHGLLERDAAAILRAFCDVFADCSLWHGNRLDLIMMGSRAARGPVSEEAFTRQWRDPAAGAELRAVGLELPEQLGALFLADADVLRDRTRNTLPLHDDRPKRLTDTPVLPDQATPVYLPWLQAVAARERFLHSELITRLWPPSMRQASAPFFATQGLITWRGLETSPDQETILRALHRVLTRSSLRTLPLWLLGSGPDQQRAAGAAEAAGRRSGELSYHLGARAMADRDYPRAADYFRESQAQGLDHPIVLAHRLLTLCMAGRAAEAHALWTQGRASPQADALTPGALRFLSEAFGAQGFGGD
ncbi:MAG: fused MFS/spermidine synthase [Candidatus Omnitrophica bacterium]|nr:fused MFS/spermidine synthase [Candidatus Omnitrophota bacterium]